MGMDTQGITGTRIISRFDRQCTETLPQPRKQEYSNATKMSGQLRQRQLTTERAGLIDVTLSSFEIELITCR